jgi:hypothetical protein
MDGCWVDNENTFPLRSSSLANQPVWLTQLLFSVTFLTPQPGEGVFHSAQLLFVRLLRPLLSTEYKKSHIGLLCPRVAHAS